jgi:hypothetical protein
MGFISKSTFRVVLTIPATLHAPVVNTAPRTLALSSTAHSTQTLQSYMYAKIKYNYLHPAEANGNNEPGRKMKKKT